MRAWMVVAVCALCAPVAAHAQDGGTANESASERPSESSVHLTIQGGTDFPIDVGGGLALELPGRLELSSDVGVLPTAYVDAANSVLVSANAYDATTGTLVHEALKNSLVWRAHLGWRPFASSGFFFQAGYGMALLNASLSAGQVLDATGVGLPYGIPPEASVELHTQVQMVDFELGWRWLVGDHVVIRTGLGAIHAFASHSTLQVHDVGVLTPYVEHLSDPSAEAIDRDVTKYGNSFELTLGIGFRPF